MSPQELEALAEAVAERVVERLRAEPAAPPSEPRLVDARALAARLGVSRAFIYANSSELGGVRLGSGPRARLRFDLKRAVEARSSAAGCTAPAVPQAAAKRRPRRAASSGELLPIGGTTQGNPRAA